ncbi:MAG TPA: hypothetical protein VIX82_09830 [Solirubrobacteraceae bacterium]
MTDPSEPTTNQPVSAGAQAPADAVPAVPGQAPLSSTPPHPGPAAPSPAPASSSAALAADRPEVAVGAAFAGGFLFAMLLKRLAR